MVIDTSVLAAIAFNDPEAAAFRERIADDPVRLISAATVLEAAMVPSPPLPGPSIRLGRTKTTTSNDDKRVVLIGRTVVALRGWLEHAGISEGPVFRRIDQ